MRESAAHKADEAMDGRRAGMTGTFKEATSTPGGDRLTAPLCGGGGAWVSAGQRCSRPASCRPGSAATTTAQTVRTMRARAHPAPPFLLYMHDHAARPRLIAEPSPSRRARSALSALHLNAASSPAQVRRSPRLKTPRARPHSPLGSGVVDTPTTWSPPEVASGMASELEDMASPLMAPARRVRQVR